MWPMRQAFSPAAVSCAIAASHWAAGTHTTMPTPQLKVRYISMRATLPVRASQRNSSGSCQLAASSTAQLPAGSTRGMFSSRPPPVMWASALMPCAVPVAAGWLASASSTVFT